MGGGCERMKIYLVVEDFDSGPGIASLNICNIFSTKERANEMKESLIKDYESILGAKYEDLQPWGQIYRVEEWEVEE
jgi:hypothetical protein